MRHDIDNLLDSLPQAADDLSLKIVVVDNCSVDDTVALVRKHIGVVCIESDVNLGYAGGINFGMRHIDQCAALVVLNPDLILHRGALRKMFNELDDPSVGIVAPMMLDSDGHRFPSLRREPTLMRTLGDTLFGRRFDRRPSWLSEMVWDEKAYESSHLIDWATGAALLISRECSETIGSWDEQFFLFSEETDYATRARRAGFGVLYQPFARVQHRGGGSGQSRELQALLAVNRIRYREKHCGRSRIYWGIVILQELLRSLDPGHRHSLRAVLRRSTWNSIVERLQAPPRDRTI